MGDLVGVDEYQRQRSRRALHAWEDDLLVEPVGFAREPFQPVSIDGTFQSARGRKSDGLARSPPEFQPLICQEEAPEVCSLKFPPLLEDKLKIVPSS